MSDELAALVQAARARWPALPIDEGSLASYLGARLTPEVAGKPWSVDLVLAWACSRGDAVALGIVEREVWPSLDGKLGRLGAPEDVVADVKQELREELFVGTPGAPRGIEAYRGRGPLRAWVRVMAVRRILRALEKARKSPERGDGALVDLLTAGTSPSVQLLRADHDAELTRWLREAIESLDGPERVVLRQQLLEGMTVEQIAAAQGIHPVTAARWLAKARRQLLVRTHRAAMKGRRLGPSDADSLLHALRSHIDLSLNRLLRTK